MNLCIRQSGLNIEAFVFLKIAITLIDSNDFNDKLFFFFIFIPYTICGTGYTKLVRTYVTNRRA